MDIAIIGAGLSGSNVARAILEHANFSADVHIDIFEPRELLGPGMPYAPDDKNVMLNIQPKYLSVDMNDRDDFIKWLDANYDEPTNYEGLVSRPQYGEYLAERFESTYNHPQVNHLQEKVVDVNTTAVQNNGKIAYQIKTEAGFKEKTYTAVFFAIGHPPYKDDYNLSGEHGYLHNPYPLNKGFSHLNSQDKIGIIGAGAASVDYFRYLTQHVELEHPLTFYVRDKGFYFPSIPYEGDPFTSTITAEWIAAEKKNNSGFIPFEKILGTVENDLDNMGVNLRSIYKQYRNYDANLVQTALNTKDQDLALIQAYIGDLGLLWPLLFNALNALEKDYYLAHYHEKLLLFKSLVPYKTALNILDHYQAGKIRIVFGLNEIIPGANNAFQLLANETETADVIINGTGFQSHLTEASKQDELIHNLYNKKFILPHQAGHFVLTDWPHSRIMNQHFGVLHNAFFLGPYIRGSEYENNNAETITTRAIAVANEFMNQLTN